LREAFRVLESEALITVRRGARGGARVHTPDGDAAARYAGLVLQFRGATLADVYEARKALELAALGAVVAKHSKETLARLEQNIDAMAAAGEPTEIMRLHDEFHRLLLESARNRTLMIFEEMIHHIVELHGEYVVTHRSKLEVRAGAVAGSRAHHRLVELIKAGNADAALDLWQRHLDEVSAIVLHDAATTTVLDLLG
jgi:DNA-binding FadR family transcriptional regulator